MQCVQMSVRESIPRQVDKKSGSARGERGPEVLEKEIEVCNSQGGGKNKLFFFFFSTFLSLNHIKRFFFSFKPGTDDYTTSNSV